MAKKQSEFALSKKLFYPGIETMVDGFRWQKDNIFTFKQDIHTINLHAISQEAEFKKSLDFSYVDNYYTIDNDRVALKKLTEKLVSSIVVQNNKNIIPAYIFLQARTDFLQAPKDSRVQSIVNRMGFNKQLLESSTQGKIFFDQRKLEQSEISLWSILQNTQQPKNKLQFHKKHKGIYYGKIDYFNLNKGEFGVIESGWFKNIANPLAYAKKSDCYFCHDEAPFSDHETCKKTGTYTSEVIKRNRARYHKLFIHQDALIKKNNNKMSFEIVELKRSFLEQHSSNRLKKFKPYFIATIKNAPFTT